LKHYFKYNGANVRIWLRIVSADIQSGLKPERTALMDPAGILGKSGQCNLDENLAQCKQYHMEQLRSDSKVKIRDFGSTI
jgi:hypothetical protein